MLPQQDWQIISKHKKEIIKLRDTYGDLLYQLITEGINKGTFKKIDIKVLIFTIVGAASYTWVWYSPEGSMSLSEIADQMSDSFLNGIISPKHQPVRNRGRCCIGGSNPSQCAVSEYIERAAPFFHRNPQLRFTKAIDTPFLAVLYFVP